MHQKRTILIASATTDLGEHHARHLTADGHTVYSADDTASLTARLTTHAIDVVVLADLERPAVSLAILRQLRAGQLHARVHPAQPVITLGQTDNLATLHAYEAGSDHHLPADVDYLILRAVIDAIARRTSDTITSRHLHVGALHIDLAARTIDISGQPVRVSRLEFDLLAKLAEDPERVYTKHELLRTVWGGKPTGSRTLDSHACRLRKRLRDAGAADDTLTNVWGTGYRFGTGA